VICHGNGRHALGFDFRHQIVNASRAIEHRILGMDMKVDEVIRRIIILARHDWRD
jgi:hypothetical protein